MKVVLRNPRREVEVTGNRRVKEILRELDIIPETVLVIRGDDLVTADQVIADGDTIELRPVMSGGAEPRISGGRSGEVSRMPEPRPSIPAQPRFKPASRLL
jgi:sulfur carrier protein